MEILCLQLESRNMKLHDQRVTYSTIKCWITDAYFDFCRDRAIVLGRPHLEILAGISYEFESSFERPVERLMMEVVCMVLTGGWYQLPMKHHQDQIQKLITENGLENLLAAVPKDEADLFRHDLKILKLA